MAAVVPLTILSETNTSAGLHLAPISPPFGHETGAMPPGDAPNMIDVNDGMHVHVAWNKAGTSALALALHNAACKWDGKAVLSSVEGGASSVATVNDQAFLANPGVETMLFNFPPNSVQPGLYKLYARINLNQGGNPAQNRGANLSIEGPLIQFFDAP